MADQDPSSNSTEVVTFQCPDCMGTGKEKPTDGGESVKPCECDSGTAIGFVKASPKGGQRHVFQLITGLALALCGHQVSAERTFDDDQKPPCLACFHVLGMLATQNGAPVNRWSGGGGPT